MHPDFRRPSGMDNNVREIASKWVSSQISFVTAHHPRIVWFISTM